MTMKTALAQLLNYNIPVNRTDDADNDLVMTTQNTTIRSLVERSSRPSEYMDVPVIGLGTPLFNTIHVTAFISLTTSALVSIALLIFLCNCTRSNKMSAGKLRGSRSEGTWQGADGTVRALETSNNGRGSHYAAKTGNNSSKRQ